ncbi:hypothetical protein CJ030_MR1G004242 [Morella rubra]|uniref:Uncharacterized protein n=1 Tax=Morella rubra TaxID=262757 RepID=A0A6A1WYR2_9ROSI|nr:hypothetical protein CJ030_MR1G004242 [Morella rubra]
MMNYRSVQGVVPPPLVELSSSLVKNYVAGSKCAVFGTEIWPAAEYGRTMYTIRQRVGPLLMKMQKRNGMLEDRGELTEKEIIREERNSGVISNRVREIQLLNSLRKREQKERREMELREGLQLYKNAKYEEALEKFESVLGSKPDPDEASIAVQAGLSALEDALEQDLKTSRIRTDPDLANIRTSPEFEPLMKSSTSRLSMKMLSMPSSLYLAYSTRTRA